MHRHPGLRRRMLVDPGESLQQLRYQTDRKRHTQHPRRRYTDGPAAMSVRAIAGRAMFSDRIDIQICQQTATGTYAASLTWLHVAEGSVLPGTQSLELAAAQELMDSLWQCGLRPTEGAGSAGALAATERHLADLRQICFSFIESPNQG